MKRVKLFCGWGKDENFLQDFIDSWGVQKYKDLEFVLNDWTHAVIFNRVFEDLKVPKENAIGFTHEPRNNVKFLEGDYIALLRRHIKRYFIDDIKDLPTDIFCLGQGFISNELGRVKDKTFIHDNNKIALIGSWKRWREGHKLRHELIEWILSTDMPIDIYGEKLQTMYTDSRVKGTFNCNDDVYPKYKFIIAIESDKTDWYISEKFYNPIAFGCIPIYWGCNQINAWYNASNITLPRDLGTIRQIIVDVNFHPEKFQMNISKARQEIFNSVQYAPEWIWRQFE